MKINQMVDVGSGSIKAGFTSDDAPRAVVPSVIGRAKHSRLEGLSLESQNLMMGDPAISSRGLLQLEYPIESGQIKNWDAFESLLQFTFTNELRTDVSEAKVLFSEPSLNSVSQREKLTQIMFENHSVQTKVENESLPQFVFMQIYATVRNIQWYLLIHWVRSLVD